MKTYCPISCGFCKVPITTGRLFFVQSTILFIETTTRQPIYPTMPTITPITVPTIIPGPKSDCEDYRVDCPHLVKQRCKIKNMRQTIALDIAIFRLVL